MIENRKHGQKTLPTWEYAGGGLVNGPFTDIVNAHLQLKNPTERPVCFKVKTTAPKQYCVRPNSGVLPPSSSKTITVMLQPMDGVPTDVARHKFMVQTCFCPPGDVDLDNIWKTISPNELMYSKLMVVFQQRTGEQAGAVKEETPSAVAFTRLVSFFLSIWSRTTSHRG
ncbi:MSP domain protein [Ancylostoma duodenale]|uniref:Major sperm protein n=1 Tax=Ancylostoma duodenale TaxID=51022 RepID=A0A0C2BVM1_9BILA|nr:MSP domain protein [Ancylostoma duodenale]